VNTSAASSERANMNEVNMRSDMMSAAKSERSTIASERTLRA
jgi:hypothetical protein